jgi:hypothetical protein
MRDWPARMIDMLWIALFALGIALFLSTEELDIVLF